MKKLIDQIRILALAAVLTAGAISFIPSGAEAGIICITSSDVCFTIYDPVTGEEESHKHGYVPAREEIDEL